MDVDLDRFRQFMKAKGVSRPCPRCDHPHWKLAKEPTPIAGAMLADETGAFNIPGERAPLIFAHCAIAASLLFTH
jgi:hypothetical protein